MPKYSYWICDLLCFGLSEIGLKMGYTPKLEVLIGKIMMNQWPLWYLIFRQTHVENMKKNRHFLFGTHIGNKQRISTNCMKSRNIFFTTFEDGPS